MNEAETRAELIDPALKEAGWGAVAGSRVRREYQITLGRLQGAAGRRNEKDIADYIFEHKGRKLAIMEAKRRDLGDTLGLGQAKRYADKLRLRFAFSTNGRKIYQVDMLTGREGYVDRCPTPEELWQLCEGELIVPRLEPGEPSIGARLEPREPSIGARLEPGEPSIGARLEPGEPSGIDWKEEFGKVPFEDKSGSWQPRYYQDLAIQRVLDNIAAGKQRILLTLATGTGKTAIAFQIAWKLFHAKWNIRGDGQRRPRILFLADRNILADQAYNAFSAFSEDALVRIDPASIRKKGRVPTNGSLFFTIFQTFMSGPGDTPYFGEYPADFFDFIVIDECHRGGANDESTWRAIMEYFKPAVQLGLTATPKRDVNADTYRYFGEPVYTYSLKEGINDGFLTPFKVRRYRTTLDQYTFVGDDTVVEGEVEAGTHFAEEEFNVTIEIEARERYRVLTLLSAIDPYEKTLVFCENQAHAALIRDLINQEKQVQDPHYCHRVTADDGAMGEEHLRDFQNNEKNIPTILTTSQKLSTGVDARNVRHIVLLRTIKSMVEFKQIIGRGTRLYDGKDYFTIHDFTRSHELFQDPEWDGDELDPGEPYEPRSRKPKGTEPPPEPPDPPDLPRRIVKIKLADGKERNIQHTVETSFWSADGRPISAAEFIDQLYGDLPHLFKSEDELRTIWILPDIRKKLLEELEQRGYPLPQLQELQKIIDARNSDLYDVLAYIAYNKQLHLREQRAQAARTKLYHYDDKQRAFLDFVLDQYVQQGVQELQQEKLGALLVLKYRSIPDAVRELGDNKRIKETFVGFQKWLYEGVGVRV